MELCDHSAQQVRVTGLERRWHCGWLEREETQQSNDRYLALMHLAQLWEHLHCGSEEARRSIVRLKHLKR